MTTIPFHDFGGDGPVLHFAHPNGYTPACFRQMVEPLLPHFRVISVCHRPLWSGTQPEEMQDWHLIARDMMDFFEQQGLENIVGAGHSLGAVITAYAAVERPNLFRTLVLIDPVFLPPSLLSLIPDTPGFFFDSFPLVQKTQKRRTHWPDRLTAFTHLRAKETFRYWSDEAVWDYVNYGTQEDPEGGVVLVYPREWEVRFYGLPPRDVWQVIPQITHPTLAIRGVESDTLSLESWQTWQQLQPQATFVEIPQAGHMVLMERPLATAQQVLRFLNLL